MFGIHSLIFFALAAAFVLCEWALRQLMKTTAFALTFIVCE